MATVTGYAHGISTRSFIDAFGYPLYLETFGPERIVFVTDIPFRVTFVGSFDYRSEASFLQSPVTALEVATLSGAAVMRAAEFRVTLKSLGRGEFGVILAGNDTITGGLGSNDLFGWGVNDVIVGGPENDVLDGSRGVDRLEGGAGWDYYYVDDPRDLIVDPDGGKVFSYAPSYTLPEPFTVLVAAPGAKKVTLIGNELDNFLSGRSGKDRLEGRGGNDSLDGDRGADTMLGGPGDDSYRVDHKRDLVVEQPGEGVDTVRASVAFTLPPGVENFILEGRAAQGIGNEEDNRIGGAGLTTLLDGRGGDDTIRVRISGDNVAVTIRGGAGADRIRWEGRPPGHATRHGGRLHPGGGRRARPPRPPAGRCVDRPAGLRPPRARCRRRLARARRRRRGGPGGLGAARAPARDRRRGSEPPGPHRLGRDRARLSGRVGPSPAAGARTAPARPGLAESPRTRSDSGRDGRMR